MKHSFLEHDCWNLWPQQNAGGFYERRTTSKHSTHANSLFKEVIASRTAGDAGNRTQETAACVKGTATCRPPTTPTEREVTDRSASLSGQVRCSRSLPDCRPAGNCLRCKLVVSLGPRLTAGIYNKLISILPHAHAHAHAQAQAQAPAPTSSSNSRSNSSLTTCRISLHGFSSCAVVSDRFALRL